MPNMTGPAGNREKKKKNQLVCKSLWTALPRGVLTAARRIGRPDGLAVVHRLHGFIHPDLVRLEVVPGHDTTVLSNGLNDILGDPSVLVVLVVLAILSSVKD